MRLYTCAILLVLLFLICEIVASSSYYKKCKSKKRHSKRKSHRSSRSCRISRKRLGNGKRTKTTVTLRRNAPDVVRIRGVAPITTARDDRVRKTGRNQRNPTVIRVSSVSKARFSGGTLGRVLNNGRVMDPYAPRQLIRGAVGTTWVNVEFGNIGMPVNKLFLVESDVNIVVRVLDLFCAGDIFDVYTIQKNTRTLLGTTSYVQSDNCDTITADPDHAWDHGQWSRGEFVLKPGRYTIMLVPHSSPYGGGSAAIRFDEETEDPSNEIPESSEWEGADQASKDSGISASSDDSSTSVSNSDSDSDSDYYSSSSEASGSGSSDSRDSGDSAERGTATKTTCKGINGFTVVQGIYKARNMEDACASYGGAAALTSSKTHKRSVLKTLQDCVVPGTSLWIASYSGASKKHYYAVTLEGPDKVSVADVSSGRKLGVLCLN